MVALSHEARARRNAEIARGVRTCTCCGEAKSLDEFYSGWDSRFKAECKVCFRTRVRARYVLARGPAYVPSLSRRIECRIRIPSTLI
jgi:hypothetical protein